MPREEILYLTPYVISLLLSISLLMVVWQRRRSPGTLAFSIYMIGQLIWVAGFFFELISNELTNKIFWDNQQWIAAMLFVIVLPVFAVQFTEHSLSNSSSFFLKLLIVPILFTLFLISDDSHHLIYKNPQLLFGSPFSILSYEFTPITVGFAFYGYCLLLWSVSILLHGTQRPHGLYRTQLILVTLGVVVPIFGTVFALLGITIGPQRDAFPLTSIIGNLIIAWALFQYRIFEVTPIGRDQVFDAMVDPVVILDTKNNVVDINTAMLAMLGKTAREVIGEPANKVFDNFPIPIKRYTQSSYARTEASFDLGGIKIHYEMTVWPLYNHRKEMTGRIYISHDITVLKQLENELRKLNTQLEDRVMSRTHELAEAYDTTLEGWARALELRDKETEGHTRRVTDTTLKIAFKLDFPEDMIEHIRRGAILHDIGKMSIPDEILHKPGSLTKEEREIVGKHPETAYRLLKPISYLERALDIPYCHHEKWDGTGYPRGLKGGEIPVAARIFAISDVWDALSYERSYNKPWSREKKVTYFIEQSGKHFDPHLVNIFLDMVEKGEI